MKALILAALVLAGPALAEKVLIVGDVELRLYDAPCTHAGTLARIKDEWRAQFKKAQATAAGALVFGCWIDIPAQAAHYILLEGIDGVAIQADAFKERMGI